MLNTTTELVRNAKVTNAFHQPASTIALDLQRCRNSVPKKLTRAQYFSVTEKEQGRAETVNRQRMAKAGI